MSFSDQTTGQILDMGKQDNWIALVDGTPEADLSDFLSRPTKIAEDVWSSSDGVGEQLAFDNPWFSYLNNPVIKKKMENYAFMRANLHIKIVINSTPFNQGLAKYVYLPLNGLTPHGAAFSSDEDVILTSISQLPGIEIQPSTSAAGEMILPFFWNRNWVDLTRSADVQQLGGSQIFVFAPLASANGGGSQSLTITTFAWLENVELMGATVAAPLQSKTSYVDDYGTGPVSAPATVIASIASKLESVPLISRFARATNIGATATARIAALFGFTNIPNINNVNAISQRVVPALSNAEVSTSIERLTLDPKQELSIDPSLLGLPGVDELSIPYIVAKQSYLFQTTFAGSNLAEDCLANIAINPGAHAMDQVSASAVDPAKVVHSHTPLSYLNEMFTFWRGAIKIRMKIVCTKFHKGRLRVIYDPRNAATNLSNEPNTYNTCYNRIVDIGEENDIIFDIPYHQSKAWLQCPKVLSGTTAAPFSYNLGEDFTVSGSTYAPFSNGILSVRVLNPLTGPATSPSVKIIFYISGGDDFEFAVPRDIVPVDNGSTPMLSFNTYQSTQSKTFYPRQGMFEVEDKVDVEPTHVVVGNPGKNQHVDRYSLNMGEQVISLRKVLHRDSILEHDFHNPLRPDNDFINSQMLPMVIVGKTFPRVPMVPGYSATGTSNCTVVLSSGNVTGKVNYVPMHPIIWVKNMFAAYRGGIHHRAVAIRGGYSIDSMSVNLTSNRATSAVDDVPQQSLWARKLNQSTAYSGSSLGLSLANGWLRFLSNFSTPGAGGAALTSTRINTGLEYSIPYYSAYNFDANSVTGTEKGSYDQSDADYMSYNLEIRYDNSLGEPIPNNVNDQSFNLPINVTTFASAAPDFQCFFFLGAPPVYQYASPAGAA